MRTSIVLSVSILSSRSDVLNSFISEVFICVVILFLYVIGPYNEFCCDRKLLGSKPESFFGNIIRYSFCFNKYPARCNRHYKTFRCPFSFAHTDLCRLLGNRFVGKYPYPELAFTFHMPCNSLTGSFNLSPCDPGLLQCFYAK